MAASPDYKEQGTGLSGYEEKGPYHCEDCVHKLAMDSDRCIHPVLVVDPALKSHAHGKTNGKAWVQINLERGCCKFVKQDEREPDADDNPVKRAAKSKT